MFEPIHGSAPDIAGQGIASPIGAILSAGLLLDYLGERQAALRIEHAVAGLLASGRLPGVDARSGLRTSEVGSLVLRAMEAEPA
jgi:3-isopropylmalate dehydrogenase